MQFFMYPDNKLLPDFVVARECLTAPTKVPLVSADLCDFYWDKVASTMLVDQKMRILADM